MNLKAMHFLNQCLGLLKNALSQTHLSEDYTPLGTRHYSHLETATLLFNRLSPEGQEREVMTLQRVNQSYFRNSLLSNYQRSCCLTSIAIPALLITSHIKPWVHSTAREKTAAADGLLLNAFHDRAFDQGLITPDNGYRIVVAHKRVKHSDVNDQWIYSFEHQPIALPLANPPSHEFIEYHRQHVFSRETA